MTFLLSWQKLLLMNAFRLIFFASLDCKGGNMDIKHIVKGIQTIFTGSGQRRIIFAG
jgi:hypothetical protein